jgi:WS/DGAT/MGAT family acyltransferase
MSGAEIMGLLLDLSPEGRDLPDAPPPEREREPSDVELLGRGLLGLPRYPARLLRSLPAAVPNIEDTPFGVLPGAGTVGRLASAVQRAVGVGGEQRGSLDRRPLVAPKTSFNGRISPHRRFAFGSLPLDAVKEVKNAHGCTVNDVVVSVCASAVRRWLVEHDELPADPLVAQIPISVRTGEQAGTFGNRIMLMAAPLFTNEPDPIRRLYATHDAMSEVKERHKALPAELLQDANHFIPPAVFHRAAQLTFRLSTSRPGRPTWNLVVSNVPGPQFPLYMAGGRLLANYPVSVITDGMGMNITVMSYDGHLDFGIVGDRDQIPDLWCVLEWLREGLDELLPGRAPEAEAEPIVAE